MIIVLQKLVHNGIFLHKGSFVNQYATLFLAEKTLQDVLSINVLCCIWAGPVYSLKSNIHASIFDDTSLGRRHLMV